MTDRTQHVWFWQQKERQWKCALCGGVISKVGCPKPDATPERYEKLTNEERAKSPMS